LLQERSLISNDVYPFWDTFQGKLKNENPYQRNIGLKIIADNAKWDVENKLDASIDDYLSFIYDEKPITVRQCIQALQKIIPYKKQLNLRIAEKLMSLKITDIKETMQKSILLDIINALTEIRKYQTTDEIDSYIMKALSGGIIDKKPKNEIEARMVQ
jgi:hypothetical protein